ncbi:hypothetical protein D3C73_1095750 [compost metagenome]
MKLYFLLNQLGRLHHGIDRMTKLTLILSWRLTKQDSQHDISSFRQKNDERLLQKSI